MTTLAKLTVQMNANSSKLTAELEKANKRAERWEKKTKRSVLGVKKAFIALGAAAAAVKFTSFIQESIAAADKIGKMSDALGLTTDQFQEYAHAADLAGVNQSQFTSNMTAFVKRVGEARSETGPLVSFLKKYDSELLVAIQRTTSQEQALGLIANAIQNAATATDRAAIANAAFSRAGVAMVNMLDDGEAGLNKYREQAQALGIVMDEAMIRNAESANDKLTILTKSLSIKATKAVVDYSREIGNLADQLLSFMRNVAEVPKFIEYLAESFAAAVHGPSDPIRIADKIEVLEKRIFSLQLSIFKVREQSGGEGLLNKLFLSNERELWDKLRAARAEMDELVARAEMFKAKPPPAVPDQSKSGDGGGGDGAPTYDVQSGPMVSHIEARNAYIAKLETDHQDSMVALYEQAEKRKRAVMASGLGAASNIFNSLSSLMAKHGKKQNAAQKIMARAGIIASTAQAVMNALAVPPYPLGVALAAGAALTGAAQLVNLNRSGGGGGGVAPISTATPAPAISSPQFQETQAQPIEQPNSQATFIIVGDSDYSESRLDDMLERVGTLINEGSRVFIRRDSPQAQEIAQAMGT